MDLEKVNKKIENLEFIRKDEQEETCRVLGQNPTNFNLNKDQMAVD